MRIYELRGRNFEMSGYVTIRTIRAEEGILNVLDIPEEYRGMYDDVWWAETGYENQRQKDIAGYYQTL